ncbi:MAG: pseudouridine synthase [Chloroflexota bacterium]
MTDEKPQGTRLAKVLAQRGIASRRAAEELIAAGVVKVNGKVAEVVTFVDPDTDTIEVRGEPLPELPKKKYYVLNKPRGYITTRSDPQGRPSVMDLTKHLPVRVESVGRLDFDTEGVLLLTNDGDLAHALTHPSREVPKRYVATVEGVPNEAALETIRKGVKLDDGWTAPAKARLLKDTGDARVEVTVHEGRNRLIRRMLKEVGHPVFALRRERFASISAEGMEPGAVRELTDAEVNDLRILAARKSRAEQRALTGRPTVQGEPAAKASAPRKTAARATPQRPKAAPVRCNSPRPRPTRKPSR